MNRITLLILAAFFFTNHFYAQNSNLDELNEVYEQFAETVENKDLTGHRELYISGNSPVNIVQKKSGGPTHLNTTNANGWINFFTTASYPYRLDITNTEFKVHNNNLAYSIANFDEYINNRHSGWGIDMFIYIKTDDGWKFTQLHNTVIINGQETGIDDPYPLPNSIENVLANTLNAIKEKDKNSFLDQHFLRQGQFLKIDSVFAESYSSSKHSAEAFINEVLNSDSNYEWEIRNVVIDTIDHYLAAVTTEYILYENGIEIEKGIQLWSMLATKSEGWKITSILNSIENNITNITDSKAKLNDFQLKQNYPNPFNPTTVIEYSIGSNVKGEMSKSSVGTSPSSAGKHGMSVQMHVYNILGQKIATLVNKQQSPGNYSVSFNAEDLTSGTYIYQLKVGGFAQTQKMVLLQ